MGGVRHAAGAPGAARSTTRITATETITGKCHPSVTIGRSIQGQQAAAQNVPVRIP
jgi:hypothetical protein